MPEKFFALLDFWPERFATPPATRSPEDDIEVRRKACEGQGDFDTGRSTGRRLQCSCSGGCNEGAGHAERGAASDFPFQVPSARTQQVQTTTYDHGTLLLNLNS